MEIRNLKTFLKVASLKNFTHAAKDLGYSQSNVSAQIAQLEQEIGVPLFNRIGRQVSLTQFGEELLPYAQELCSIAVKMENMSKSEEFLCGTVRIGLTDSISELLLEDALFAYHRRFPLVQVEVVLDTSAMLLDRMRKGELDAACLIAGALPSTEWFVRSERSVPVVVAANPTLPVTAKKAVSLEDLAEQKLVLMETSAPYSLQFEQALSQKQISCRPVFRLQSALTALRMAEREGFVTILPLYTLKASAEEGRVIILNVPEWKHQQAVQTVLHRSRALTPQIAGFLDELNSLLDNILVRRT